MRILQYQGDESNRKDGYSAGSKHIKKHDSFDEDFSTYDVIF